MTSDQKVHALQLRRRDLSSKVAVVTGASKGIGRAVTLNVASRGCSVLGTCSSPESLHLIDSLAHEISDLYESSALSVPKVRGIVSDNSSPTCHQDIANAIEREFASHVDIYINNAAPRTMAGIGSLDAEHIRTFCHANIETPALIADEFVKRKMFRNDSRIVFISSARGRKVNHKTYVCILNQCVPVESTDS
jgi:NAD(P)-dependent dehydrogenase (short-subunit alcohol dehydrogenase family)